MRDRDPEEVPDQSARAPERRRDAFAAIATMAIRLAGSKWAFVAAALCVVAWASMGPYFGYSDHWQIVINTGTTIVTFLMVFLIQNAQNRESKAIHLKLDELIYAVRRANNNVINAEQLSEEELDRLGNRYREVAEESRRSLEGKLGEVGHEVEEIGHEVEEVEQRVKGVEEKLK